MPIVFVRHAKTVVDPDVHPSKWELTPEGKIQANKLADTLQDLDFVPSFIYTSGEDKTVKTMEPYNEAIGGNIFALPQLNELHFPSFAPTQEEFENNRKRQFEQPDLSFNGSETATEALTRFKSGMDIITEDNAVVCTHGTVLSLFLADRRGWSPEKTFDFWKDLPFGEIVAFID